mgnify:CR=1 FL=1
MWTFLWLWGGAFAPHAPPLWTGLYNMEHYTMKFVPLTFLEIDIRSLKDLASFKVHMSISRHVRDMKFILKYSLYP